MKRYKKRRTGSLLHKLREREKTNEDSDRVQVHAVGLRSRQAGFKKIIFGKFSH